MGIFSTNYDDVGSFDLLDPGEYEVIISSAEPGVAKSGKNKVDLTLTVRTDVDQPFQKRKLFETLTESENTIFKFQQVAKAVGIAPGLEIQSLQHFASLVKFKAVRVKVTKKEETYQGVTEMRNRIAFFAEAKVSYHGGDPSNGSMSDPFAATGADAPPPPPGDNNAPPPPPPPATGAAKKDKKPKAGTTPPWEKPADPFADDGKPIDISEDDLPF
jgi:hypothetical protein